MYWIKYCRILSFQQIKPIAVLSHIKHAQQFLIIQKKIKIQCFLTKRMFGVFLDESTSNNPATANWKIRFMTWNNHDCNLSYNLFLVFLVLPMQIDLYQQN